MNISNCAVENKTYTEIAYTQIHNNVYFWAERKGIEYKQNRGDSKHNVFFIKRRENGADMKLKLNKYGLVGTKWFIMLFFPTVYIKI